MAGFLRMPSLHRDRIRTTIFRNCGPVSTQPLKNSRFWETRLRDRRIKPLLGRGWQCKDKFRRLQRVSRDHFIRFVAPLFRTFGIEKITQDPRGFVTCRGEKYQAEPKVYFKFAFRIHYDVFEVRFWFASMLRMLSQADLGLAFAADAQAGGTDQDHSRPTSLNQRRHPADLILNAVAISVSRRSSPQPAVTQLVVFLTGQDLAKQVFIMANHFLMASTKEIIDATSHRFPRSDRCYPCIVGSWSKVERKRLFG
ncbi:hypothetical protein HNQ36_003671 [Afipia massiliensis]|uniref:Uncharacterized protein n=1 Tax=Afipia massiliensis TaxID=211460 RepID=A0A840N7D6_9BRAD|nr:hypothetical protein [Afipia massiliensis]